MCLSELISCEAKALVNELSRFFIANNLTEALKHWPAARVAQATIFSQEGEMLLPDGRVHILGQNGQGVLKRKNDIVELDKKVLSLSATVVKNKELFAQNGQKLLAFEYERDQLLRDLQPLNYSLVRLEESLKQKKLEFSKAQSEIDRFKEKILSLQQKAHNTDEKIADLQKGWADALNEHKVCEEALELMKDAKILAESAYELQLESLKTIEIKRASLKEKLENTAQNLKDAQKNLDHLEAQKDMLSEQVSDKSAEEIRLNENER